MDRKTIEDFEREHHYTLPESYINFLLISDNNPQEYCTSYGDICLCSLEELPEERQMHEMEKYCPEYIAIGWGGGGEVQFIGLMKNADSLFDC